MKPRLDDGLGERRKKEKTGFKVDRSARYMEKHRKEQELLTGKKSAANKKKADATKAPARLRELKFDPKDRENYLLSLHKKKNERRVTAMIESRRRVSNENKRFRREAREEARKQYNSYAKVPILPNYTFKLPDPLAEDAAADDEQVEDDDEDEVIDDDDGSMLPGDVAAVFEGQRVAANVTGMSLYTSETGAVTVDVQPLFGRRGVSVDGSNAKQGTLSSGAKNRFVGGLDFSDLPSDVAGKLKQLMDEHKGPARTKPRVNLVREMQKYHKIRKHSRKKKG